MARGEDCADRTVAPHALRRQALAGARARCLLPHPTQHCARTLRAARQAAAHAARGGIEACSGMWRPTWG
eukprot:SAG11_NODE_1074_length_5968_cov_2.041063_5_plen_70_part_00